MLTLNQKTQSDVRACFLSRCGETRNTPAYIVPDAGHDELLMWADYMLDQHCYNPDGTLLFPDANGIEDERGDSIVIASALNSGNLNPFVLGLAYEDGLNLRAFSLALKEGLDPAAFCQAVCQGLDAGVFSQALEDGLDPAVFSAVMFRNAGDPQHAFDVEAFTLALRNGYEAECFAALVARYDNGTLNGLLVNFNESAADRLAYPDPMDRVLAQVGDREETVFANATC